MIVTRILVFASLHLFLHLLTSVAGTDPTDDTKFFIFSFFDVRFEKFFPGAFSSLLCDGFYSKVIDVKRCSSKADGRAGDVLGGQASFFAIPQKIKRMSITSQ